MMGAARTAALLVTAVVLAAALLVVAPDAFADLGGITIGQEVDVDAAAAAGIISELSRLAGVLRGLAIAASTLAIVVAVIRAALFGGDAANSAAASRIVRVLLIVAIVTGMPAIAQWVFAETAHAQGMGQEEVLEE